jgi:hypothetical protein
VTGYVFGDGDVQLVDEATILPYQERSTLYDTNTSNSNGVVTDVEAMHA